MTRHAPAIDSAVEDYALRLDRAGASGLDAAERATLVPALRLMDAKVDLIRRRAAQHGGDFSRSPVSE